MKQSIFVVLLFFSISLSAQKEVEFGELSNFHKNFTTYEKDTTASAVCLYEKGKNFFEVRKGYVRLVTQYHGIIKILKSEGFEHADIEIPYYHNDKSAEKVQKIRAFTYNDGAKMGLGKENIFEVDLSDRWSAKRFTFPNIKVGSVLEYTYETESPFIFNLTGWGFQSDIPKVYSEYNAEIPGNYVYNRSMKGGFQLDINEADIKRNCFSIPSSNNNADCEVLKYAMNNIPAFSEDEQFMLAKDNYISKLEFELSEYRGFDGKTDKYTKTWKDVDKEFKNDKDIGTQLRKKNFFESHVPENLLAEGDELTRARNIFLFVQNHYTWNEKYGLWRNNRVKKAFSEKIGSAAEINITLINLLNAANIDVEMMLLATRERGLPNKTHPVMDDFNYLVAKAEIGGKTYLLDATEDEVPFGMIPYRCLNYFGRVMDFHNESYWYDIKLTNQNKRTVRAQITLDPENEKVFGMFDDISLGYESIFQKKKIASMSNEDFLEEIENNSGGDIQVMSHEIKANNPSKSLLSQRFQFETEDLGQSGTLYFNPFLIRFFKTNPFVSEERHFPIDFGYERNYGFSATIKIPDDYKIKDLPESLNLALPQDSGLLRFKCSENNGLISIFFDLKLNATQYTSDAYGYVKTFFAKAVDIQKQSLIVLEKI